MIKEFVTAWDKNKFKLEEHLRANNQDTYDEYEDLVKLLFDIVINPELMYGRSFNTDKILVIDDGDYQGTQIFVLHQDYYQPSVDEYVYTHTDYGSCSGCDTLQHIRMLNYHDKPTERQVKDYMTLCLHLLQRCTQMVDSEPKGETNA